MQHVRLSEPGNSLGERKVHGSVHCKVSIRKEVSDHCLPLGGTGWTKLVPRWEPQHRVLQQAISQTPLKI